VSGKKFRRHLERQEKIPKTGNNLKSSGRNQTIKVKPFSSLSAFKGLLGLACKK